MDRKAVIVLVLSVLFLIFWFDRFAPIASDTTQKPSNIKSNKETNNKIDFIDTVVPEKSLKKTEKVEEKNIVLKSKLTELAIDSYSRNKNNKTIRF